MVVHEFPMVSYGLQAEPYRTNAEQYRRLFTSFITILYKKYALSICAQLKSYQWPQLTAFGMRRNIPLTAHKFAVHSTFRGFLLNSHLVFKTFKSLN